MCDTLVALGNATIDGTTLFAKNSDREPNEAQVLEIYPARDFYPGERLKCTYLDIPQVEHTYAILISRPFWMWGAEMGSNEHGLTIGNEAVFTRVPHEQKPALTGMDLLRLALERCKTAREGVELIVDLLQRYGQGGNCGFQHKLYYHNSFLLADPVEAWVLETAGKMWAAQKVRDVRSISNRLTIGQDWDLISDDLIPYAVQKGWCKLARDFDFAKCYSDFLYTPLSDSQNRHACTSQSLAAGKGKIDTGSMIHFLRSHGSEESANWTPAGRITGSTVCMHAGWGPIRGSQSVGSLVSHISTGITTHWVTGTSAPCTGIFKPVWLDSGLPAQDTNTAGEYSPTSQFWSHELIHRRILKNYQEGRRRISPEQSEIEKRFVELAKEICATNKADRGQFSQRCFKEAQDMESRWLEYLEDMPVEKNDILYSAAWRQFNREAKIPEKYR